jgi:cytochrome c oxidase cbb3-type subunit 4
MNAAEFHGLWTGVLLVIFIGIIVWAWSGKRKRDFDEAARLPLDDDEPGSTAEIKRNHND